MSIKKGDIILAPFPFTDLSQNKLRPAVILWLDEYFVDTDQYADMEEEQDMRPVEIIQQKDIQLICYQWFTF